MTDDSPPPPPVDRPVPPPVTGGGSPETTDPWLGVTLADRYIIESKLGSGGMGVVYRACQVSVNRAVAIKVLPASLGEDWELVRRFMREAKLASTLSHPNTVTLHDFGQIPTGALFLVMELVEGETLESHLSRVGRLPMARAIAIAVQVLDALEEAHGRGIIHRDLKPGNIILSPRAGRPDFIKLLDFGLARGADEGTGNTTRSGAILGTPAYMSPEQGRGQECDPRSDLYSLGILLFELLTGVRPFGGTTNLAILLKHFQEPVPRLSERCPALGVNEALEAALACALAKQRDDRFASAALMRTALIAAVRGTLNSSPSGTPASIPRAPSLAKDPAVAVAVADTLPEIRESGAPASTPRSPAAGESPGVVISGSAPGAAATSGSARGAAGSLAPSSSRAWSTPWSAEWPGWRSAYRSGRWCRPGRRSGPAACR